MPVPKALLLLPVGKGRPLGTMVPGSNAPKVEKGMFSLPPSLPRLLKPSIKKEYDAIEASWGEGVGFFGPLLHS